MINLVVDSQEIRLYGTPTVIADGSVEFVDFQFVFSPEWAGYVKVAQFIQAGVTTNIVINPDDTCYLPPEIGEGMASLSVFGQAPNLSPRATTNKVSFQVLSSGLPENPDIPPSPDLYAQLIGAITDAKEYVVGVEEDIQQAILGANQAAELTEQAVSDAELAAQAANQAAELADGAAGRANSAADLAEQRAAEAELAKTGANSAASSAAQAAQAAGQATTEALAAKRATETAIFNAEMHTARAKNAADALEPIIAHADQVLGAVPGALEAEVQRVSNLIGEAEQAREEAEALRVAAEATRMGFKPMGAYNPANENKYGEWYTHEGGSWGYIWPEPSTGVPLTDASHWQQIASQGLKGDPGDPFEYEDFTSEQLEGLVGNGIKSILRTSGDGTPGTTDTYTITYTDATIDTFTVYNGTNGVTTASQLPIVDAGEYFTTHNVEEALQEVGAQFVASELPVATYTYNGNAEIVVSAVDVDTDTFTSVGHGLLDTDRIFPTLNLSVIGKYPLQVYAGGMAHIIYYVVNKTDDTFQISLTSGGAAVNLTTNATIDLASWHFEKGVVDGIIISGLTAKKKYRAVAHGKYSSPGARYFAPFKPTSWSDTTGFAGGLSTTGYTYPSSSVAGYGGIQIIAKMEFDTTLGWISMEYQCVDVNTGDAAKVTPTYSTDICSIPYTLKNTEITAIRFKQHNQFVANGTTMEVYDA